MLNLVAGHITAGMEEGKLFKGTRKTEVTNIHS